MQVGTNELKNIVASLLPATSTKNLVSQMDHVIFKNGLVFSYNDSICISHPFEEGLDASVVGSDLLTVLKSIKDDELEMEMDDDLLVITSDSTEAKLSTEVDDPKVEAMFASLKLDDLEFGDIPKDFAEGLAMCQFSISKDMTSDRLLYCAQIKGKTIIGTDSVRVSKYEMKKKMDSMFLPSAVIPELLNFDIQGYVVDNGWAHFLVEDDSTFSCRLVEDNGNFPKVKSFFNTEDVIEIKLPKELKDMLIEMAPMCKGDSEIDKEVSIQMKNKELICTASKERGELTKTVKTKSKEKVSFVVNPLFLSQMMGTIDTISVDTEGGKALMESDNFSHLLMLMV